MNLVDAGFHEFLEKFQFNECGYLTLNIIDEKSTKIIDEEIRGQLIKKYINEFWTSKQRQTESIHEVSYRACFKPQLPAFFIRKFTQPEDVVYDPFSGRGTTPVEAALRGRKVIANDINPLSKILSEPRLSPPNIQDVSNRLKSIPFDKTKKAEIDLSMFYHPDTEGEIVSLKEFLRQKKETGAEDEIDKWIRMVATNRLTGHSSGFFSVYTLPPNQAVTPERQVRINLLRNQKPEYRDVKKLILKKTKQLTKELGPDLVSNLKKAGKTAVFLTEDASNTPQIESESVQLTVTSPPFLDIVQYSTDNWLRCWFNSLDDKAIAKKITMSRTVDDWSKKMGLVFKELYRITKRGGWVAFEVGEVRKGTIRLDEYVVPLGIDAGFECFGIVINDQKFTKTANIWGVNNNYLGTNTNRIVVFRKKEV